MQVAQDPAHLREVALEQRRKAETQALTTLCWALPTQVHPQYIEWVENPEVHNTGIDELFSCLMNGVWKAQKIPLAVAEVYFSDPKATPWLRCSQCQLLLPKRRGFWHNTQTGGWWQSCMRYFQKCPGCQGEIVPRGEDRSWQPVSPFPLRPVPPWEFLDEQPAKGSKP
jgi:hypothetical protein